MKIFCFKCFGFGTCPKGSCTEVIPADAVERWAWKHRNAAKPEEIIAAAVIQSFAKDFDKWEAKHFDNAEDAYNQEGGYLRFASKETNIQRIPEYKYNSSGPNTYRFNGMTVNDIEMPKYLEKAIIDGWNKIAVEMKRTLETAAKAKKAMDTNETAWDLAEKLLDMKRTDSGALVPKETVK